MLRHFTLNITYGVISKQVFNTTGHTFTRPLLSKPTSSLFHTSMDSKEKMPKKGGKGTYGDPRSTELNERKMTRNAMTEIEKEKYLTMDLTMKRKVYKCKARFVTLEHVPTWDEYYKKNIEKLQKKWRGKPMPEQKYEENEDLNKKVSIWRGDITTLEIDAIINAANNSLLGGGGVDGAIHAAAGPMLREECSTKGGCETGDAKLTGGYKLPAKYIIHTVGPIGKSERMLASCYNKCFKVLSHHNLTSMAFPCISTGIYGYPNDNAANLAMHLTREFLETKEGNKIDRVIFCLFMPVDVDLYEKYMQFYFPCSKPADIKEEKPVKEVKEESQSPGKNDEQKLAGNKEGESLVVEKDNVSKEAETECKENKQGKDNDKLKPVKDESQDKETTQGVDSGQSIKTEERDESASEADNAKDTADNTTHQAESTIPSVEEKKSNQSDTQMDQDNIAEVHKPIEPEKGKLSTKL